nr:hypothetical protein [Tanacetum cinerariifolium]
MLSWKPVAKTVRIKRYIDTIPNHELIHYCLKNPPYELGWIDKEIPISEGSPITRSERFQETYKNVSQEIRDKLNAEAEAVQIILTGIDNDIYSTVDACPNAFNEIRAERIARVANPLTLVAQQQPVYHPQTHPTHYTQNSSTKSQQAATRNRGKAIVNSPTPIYDQEPSMVAEDDEMIGNVVGGRETVGSTVVQKYGIQCYNCKEFGHVARECQKPKWVKDAAYHREKMLLSYYMYMAQLQEVSPDAADSGPIFDAEPVQKVLHGDHYNVFAIESAHPKQSNSMHDTYPIEQDARNVIIDSLDMSNDKIEIDQNDDDNDLAKERELLASLIEKLKCETDESKNRNNFLETSNKVLVEKLKGEIEDFKNKNKSLESSNNYFKEANNRLFEINNLLYTDYKKSEAELARHNSREYASQMEIECAKVRGDFLSYKMEYQKSCTKYTQTINDLNQMISKMKDKLSAHQETIFILSQSKETQIKLYKTQEDKDLDKVIELENKVKVLDNIVYKTGQSVQMINMLNNKCRTSFTEPEFLKKDQGANPRLYDIGCYNDNLATKEFYKEREQYFEIHDLKAQLQDKGIVISELKKLIEKLKGKSVETKFEKSSVIRQPNDFKSQRPSVLGRPTTFLNSFDRRDFSKSKSVTQNNVSNDFSKPVTAQTLPSNKKSILKNTNVLAPGMYKLHTDHNQARTSQLSQDSRKTNKRVSFSTGVILTTSVSRPHLKSNPMGDRVMRNNSQGKKQEVEDQRRNVKLPKNKTFVTACNDSLNAMTLNFTKKIYERVSKTCSWWYPKFTPSGYTWKPKSGKENVNLNLVEIVLFIIDSGCSKHMTGNLKLLINFMEKFLGTVKFRNEQIAPILGYRDLVQGAVMIKSVYYVEGLNYNLFFVSQFCHADLEVAFGKSTCYIRDLKGNDLLIGLSKEDFKLKRNRTLIEAARTMLSAAKVPLFFWAKAIATACFTQNRSLVIPRHKKTPYHIINDRKPSVKFFYIFGSLCYIVRDGENLDKMKEKGDACIFVGYATQSRAYRVFNKRTRVIIESIHANFDELPNMASDHVSSNPAPECQRMALEHGSLSPGPQHQENVTQVDKIVIMSNELDLLFSLMFDKLLNGSSKVVSKSSDVSATDAPNQRQQHTTSLNTHTTPAPTCQVLTHVPTVASTENMNQAEMVKEYAQVENDEFINIFYHPLEQVIGNPSQSVRTRRQLESNGEMCMFALTVSQTEPKNIKEAMADSAWIESMQEEFHQFDRLE